MGRPATKKLLLLMGDAAATKTVTKAPAAKTAAKKSGTKRHRSAYNIFVAEVSPAIAATLKEEGKKDKMMTVGSALEGSRRQKQIPQDG
uniref:Histone H2B n=1 Tax=Ditylenchus dipsaci TaxID=166011 RepID=A0A915EN80_9BILA